MDPGNWATDLAGGSRFGYSLLSVILVSNLMAILLQSLCARLGIATGRDLAQACRDHFSRPVNLVLWLLCEAAICACDLAEVIGSAIALNLLFGIPLVAGVVLTALDVFLVMYLTHRSFRWLEGVVISLILLIGGCFLAQILFARPDPAAVFRGFVPSPDILRDPAMLYIAIGILGATVMPHNLYLQSALVHTRQWQEIPRARHWALRYATADTLLALVFAFLVNAAILVLAATAFHGAGRPVVEDLDQAYRLLTPLVGTSLASTLFGVALLAAGQSSTVTATMAGQVVMEGFLDLRLPSWQRRLLTRGLALIPALATVLLLGDRSSNQLLVLSQVVLSLQLPFAVVPLVLFCSRRELMGDLATPRWLQAVAWVFAGLIVAINLGLLVSVATGFSPGAA